METGLKVRRSTEERPREFANWKYTGVLLITVLLGYLNRQLPTGYSGLLRPSLPHQGLSVLCLRCYDHRVPIFYRQYHDNLGDVSPNRFQLGPQYPRKMRRRRNGRVSRSCIQHGPRHRNRGAARAGDLGSAYEQTKKGCRDSHVWFESGVRLFLILLTPCILLRGTASPPSI